MGVSARSAFAQAVGTGFTYQGSLTNAGVPSGPVDLQFRLYSAASGVGGQIGAQLQALNVTPADGKFTVSLNFGATAFTGTARWLEIDARPAGGGAYTTLAPRQRLDATPYAQFALNVSPTAVPWTFNGLNAVFTSGNVGAGTASPTARLMVLGADGVTGQSLNVNNKFFVTNTFTGVGRSTTLGGAEFFGIQAPITGNTYGGMYIRTDSATGKPFYGYANTGGSSMWTYLDGATNAWIVNNSGDRFAVLNSGNVGVGTLTPAAQFEVSSGGQFPIRGISSNTGGAWFALSNTGGGREWNLISTGTANSEGAGKLLVRDAAGGGAVRMTFDTAGNVGVGTVTPAARLDVAGSGAFAGLVAFNNAAAPFSVANTTKVTNLNADLLDGIDSSAFLTSIPIPLQLNGSNAGSSIISATNSSSAAGSAAIRGTVSTVTVNQVWGVHGITAGGGAGVYGQNTRTGSFVGTGVYGSVAVDSGIGVEGRALSTTGASYGVYGQTLSTNSNAAGVVGISSAGKGILGNSTSNDAVGAVSSSGAGVRASTSSGPYAVYGERTANANRGWLGGINEGGWAESLAGDGFVAKSFAANRSGIYAENTVTSGTAYGGYFVNNTTGGSAVYCRSNNGSGIALFADGEAKVKVLTILGGSDLAEPFDVAASTTVSGQTSATAVEPLPGMVVSIDPANPGKLIVASGSYDRKVAGIISGANGLNPGMVMQAVGVEHAHGEHRVAMTGRVWCYADTSAAGIEPGDRLTTSPTPGHTMKVQDESRANGAVIGKAMTPLAKGEKGMVLVLVNLQ